MLVAYSSIFNWYIHLVLHYNHVTIINKKIMKCVDIEIRVYATSNLDFFSKEQPNYFVTFVLVSLLRLCSKATSIERQLNEDFIFFLETG